MWGISQLYFRLVSILAKHNILTCISLLTPANANSDTSRHVVFLLLQLLLQEEEAHLRHKGLQSKQISNKLRR